LETWLSREAYLGLSVPGTAGRFIGTGLGTLWAIEAADLLATTGTSASVLHVPTLKPLDTSAVVEFAERSRFVVTVENHSLIGGLGSAVCEAVAESGRGARVRRLGVPDSWGEAGPLDYLRTRLGLDGPSLAKAVAEFIGGH
jgi:transketolase